MVERTVKILNKLGLHARPASLFVQNANKFRSHIDVIKNGEVVNGKSILGMMSLAVAENEEITIRINGEDEEEMMNVLVSLIADKFGEE
ncbi:MAG: HPr family phosphocarrier protein [bacterium]